jgi:serine protease Do
MKSAIRNPQSAIPKGRACYFDGFGYCYGMWNKMLCLALLLGGFALPAATVQLKDKASVSGAILAEKPNEVVIDIGYTVLVIPRNQIIELLNDNTPEPAGPAAVPTVAAIPEAPAAPPLAPLPRPGAASGQGFFSSGAGLLKERSVRELAAELGAAVVQVRTPAGLGSGFFINEDGFLITNFHVTEGETQITVEVFQQKNGELERQTYKQVKIVALNKFGDLALLKVEDKDAPKFARVSLGDSDTLAVGERVFAIGSPMGLERSVTEGIVSTKTRQLQGDLYLQTTAQINPGNSGGPLFNLRGEVVGVTNMKITSGEGLGFAIPVESVIFFLKHRDSFSYDNDNPSNAYRYLEPTRRLKKTSAP